MTSRLDFNVHMGPGTAPARSRPGPNSGSRSTRLLLLGDFTGQGAAPSARWSPKARRVDIDQLDAVLQAFAPRLQLPLQGQTVDFAPQTLDDFHPDQLLLLLPPLHKGLQRLQALQDPARFAQAAADWDLMQGAHAAAAAGAPPPAAASSAADLLSTLLGGTVKMAPAAAAPIAPAASVRTGIEALLHSAVAGNLVPAAPQHQPGYVAAAQAALSQDLRAVLHHPAFQALEGCWRGVQELVSQLELSETLQLHLVDARRQDLLADLIDAQGRAHATALAALLMHKSSDQGGGDAGGRYWHTAFALFSFADTAVDLGLLAALGVAATQAQTPLVAAAAPPLVHTALQTVPQTVPQTAAAPPTAQPSSWQQLRRSAVAPFLGLVQGGLLLRLPYGRHLESVADLDFEEITDSDQAPKLLWGAGALATAALMGRNVTEQVTGPATAQGGRLTLHGLPAWQRRDADGEAALQACTQQTLDEAQTAALLAAGLMPLVSHRHQAALTLARWQSIAEPSSFMMRGSAPDHGTLPH